jgi:hypothetical protein
MFRAALKSEFRGLLSAGDALRNLTTSNGIMVSAASLLEGLDIEGGRTEEVIDDGYWRQDGGNGDFGRLATSSSYVNYEC